MLQDINNRIQGWIAGVIVGLIAVTFTLWGIQSYLEGHNSNSTKAKVNGVKISHAEYENAYQRLRRQQQMQLGANFSLTPAVVKQLKKQALQQLVMNTALRTAAIDDGYFISQQQAENAISQIPAFQDNGQFSEQKFIQTLNAALYTPEAFVHQLQSDMLVNQLRAGIAATAFVLPSDVQRAMQLIDQQRSIRYISIPSKNFADTIKPTDKEMQAYYDANKKLFTSPEKISLSYLQLSLKQMMAKLNFTNDQLKTYYTENSDNYKTPPSWRVAHILIAIPGSAMPKQVEQIKQKAESIQKQAVAGKNFAKLAKKYSSDALSAKKGGELPLIRPGSLSPQFEQAVALLTKPGQISEPVRTKYGFEIIKLLDLTKAKKIPFDKVKKSIASTMAAQQSQSRFADLNDQLANLTYSNPDSLQAASKALNLPIKTTGSFTKEGGNDAISKNPKVLAAAFSPDVLENGDNSDVIQLDGDSVVVVRVNNHQRATAIPFAKVKAKIREHIVAEKSQQKAAEYAQSLLKDVNTSADRQLQLMMRARNLTWQTAKNIQRNNTKINPSIVDLAFQLPHPSSIDKTPSNVVKLESGDYALVSLSNVNSKPSQTVIAQQKLFKQQIENSMGLFDYGLYVQGVMSKATVKTFN